MAVLFTGDTATSNAELLENGLWLSLIGMGAVFAVLSILAISVKTIERVEGLLTQSPAEDSAPSRPAPRPAATPARPAELAPEPTPAQAVDQGDDALTAAAIGVALALSEVERSSTGTGSAAAHAASSNAWVTAGRSRELSRRTPPQPLGARIRR